MEMPLEKVRIERGGNRMSIKASTTGRRDSGRIRFLSYPTKRQPRGAIFLYARLIHVWGPK
jgi:hypothetical protein